VADGEVTGGKVGAERSETDWREATAAQRDRRWARSTWEDQKTKSLRSRKTAEPQRPAAMSPLADLDGGSAYGAD